MAEVHFSKKAVQDLADIWNYTLTEWSERQADKYYSTLIQACQEIATDRMKGKSYENIAENIRGLLIFRHIILFKRISTTEILVVRILHAQMDLKSKEFE
jgi:toxin ParE1/3/4